MPITLPAHAAAILPIHRLARGRAHALGLLAGCVAPDAAYLLGATARTSHVPLGVVTICLPVALALVAWGDALLLPALARTVPAGRLIDWPRLLAPRPLPRTVGAVAALVASILAGAATHLLWDGFTHAGWWPARALYPDAAGLPLLLWRWSSWIGSACVIGWVLVAYRARPAARFRPLPLLLVGALTVAAAVAAGWWRLRWAPAGDRNPHWHAQLAGAAGGFAALTAFAAARVLRRR